MCIAVCCSVRFSLGRLVTKSIVVVCPRNVLFFLFDALLFPLLTVTFNFLVVYLEDGSFLTIFNRSILQSVSIFFLRHRVLPAVVEDTLEAHTYGRAGWPLLQKAIGTAHIKLISAATKRWDY